jgi:hypothetical protein
MLNRDSQVGAGTDRPGKIVYDPHFGHARVVFVHDTRSCKASGESLAYERISASSRLGRDPGCDFRRMYVWHVIGDPVKGTIGIRIDEMIPKAVCDAVEEEIRVVIVSESPMPGLCPVHYGERTGRKAREKQYSSDVFGASGSCRARKLLCTGEQTFRVE